MKYESGALEIDNFYLSKKYEQGLEEEVRKSKGIYYTPKIIVDYIIDKTLKNHDIVKNPYVKVLDFSCGCGNFLLEAYDVLYELFEEHIDDLYEKYKDKYWDIENIPKHIIENCIYGVDIDKEALNVFKNALSKKTNTENYKINIYCEDGLKKNWQCKFDYVVGNPPYIGHKLLDKEYKKYLLKEYKEVYKDKSDLYFCFYKKSIDIVKNKGLICMITPRYFLQSPSGIYLRSYINDKMDIKEIVDFLGADVFKNIGIASCILLLESQNKKVKNNKINIYKIKNENLKINEYEDLSYLLKEDKFENYKLNQESLNENWLIANEDDKKFYEKIQLNCNYYLHDIVSSFQGIITGCDKAFIIKKDNEYIEYVPKEILKIWVKNKNINKYIIDESNLRLIYSNDLDNLNIFKEDVINKFIINYKEKLENRRECKKNIRKWYELQWGREKYLFEQVKIMYPYKSKENKFAIDYNNSYCSADVYSFFIKENYKKEFSYEYLVGLLNSRVYDKYFKITAKNMGKDIYDYYPNKVMDIKIFKDENYYEIESLSKQIIEICKNEKVLNEYDKEKINNIEIKINNLIKKSLRV